MPRNAKKMLEKSCFFMEKLIEKKEFFIKILIFSRERLSAGFFQ
jgi:hypothetical protein